MQQQQQQQNSTAAALTQLTANLNSPPVLFVYIIDPFDYYLYLNLKEAKSNPQSSERKSAKFGTGGDDREAKFKEEKKAKTENADDEVFETAKENCGGNDQHAPDESETNDSEQTFSSESEYSFNEFGLKRLRTLGLFKAYLEFLNNIPDLFKYSTQFQIIPLSLCMDLQQQSTSERLHR